MLGKYLQKNPMKSLILMFLGLGLFWFYIMLHPWLAFLNSDSAVPFQMVLEPWLPQDLFYWQTSRMGMMYEVVWKAILSLFSIRESVVGSMFHAELFYLFHVLFVFLGFPFWLQTFEGAFSKWLFFLFFIPLTHAAVDHNLNPGQPYGVLFTINGMFYWTLLKYRESMSKHLLLGCLLGIMFIQHELAFLILCGVYASKYLQHAKDFISSGSKVTGLVLSLWMVIGFYFKARSREWDPGAHYRLTDLTGFLRQLQVTFSHGRWAFDIQRIPGHLLTLAAIVYVVQMLQSKQRKFFLRDVEQTTFVGALTAFFLIHLTRWFALNGNDPRYFTNLTPLFIWVFIKKLDGMSWAELRPFKVSTRVYLAACVVPLVTHQTVSDWLNPIERVQASLPEESGTDFSSRSIRDWAPGINVEAYRMLSLRRLEQLTRAVQVENCAGYIDDYWNSHILVVSSGGKIVASAGTHIRNPILFERIRASRPLCVMVRQAALQKYVSDLDCKKSIYGFFVCNDPIK